MHRVDKPFSPPPVHADFRSRPRSPESTIDQRMGSRETPSPDQLEARIQRAQLLGHRVIGEPRRAPANTVQRLIVITPQAYAQGLGLTLDQLDDAQLDEYFDLAIRDDLAYAIQIAAGLDNSKAAKYFRRANSFPEKSREEKLGLLAELPGNINHCIRAGYKKFKPDQNPGGPAQPNRDTRYATMPKSVFEGDEYQHTSLTHRGQPEGVMWGSDESMYESLGQAIGPVLLAGALGQEDPAYHKESLPITRLPWEVAKQILPRPLINLMFDVRFQLDSGAVVDERTEDEKKRKEKSPDAPGTLRSWHQDSSGRLPQNQFDKDAPQPALHGHYATHSQTGAGSAIVKGRQGPEGFAEYTGTGSDWEHNTKVVLDYTQGRIYLTLTHYQFWALIADGGGYDFWPSGTQELGQAQGRLNERLKELPVDRNRQVLLMSPWMEIEMPSLGPQPFVRSPDWEQPDFVEQVAFEKLLEQPGVQQVGQAFVIERVSGDQMNCFLRCMARAYGREDSETIGQLRQAIVQADIGIAAGEQIDISHPSGQRALAILARQGFTNCTVHIVQAPPNTDQVILIGSLQLGSGGLQIYILHSGAHFSYLIPKVDQPLEQVTSPRTLRVDYTPQKLQSSGGTSSSPPQVSKIRQRHRRMIEGSQSEARRNVSQVPADQLQQEIGRDRRQTQLTLGQRWQQLEPWQRSALSFGTPTVVLVILLFLAYLFLS